MLHANDDRFASWKRHSFLLLKSSVLANLWYYVCQFLLECEKALQALQVLIGISELCLTIDKRTR